MPKLPNLFLCLFLVLSISGLVLAESSAFPKPSNPGPVEWISRQWQRLQNLTQPAPAYQPTFSKQNINGEKEYIVGIHPLHNPKRLFDIYGPIVDAISAKTHTSRFKLEASRNYEEFEKKLFSGHFDFAMPNPLQTIKALDHGYRIFGKMADDENFRGIILVRKDSGIDSVTDLKGKVVAYPAKTALAATILPQYYLHTHGLDVNTDIQNHYVGSQESAIMHVLLGHAAAAATWPVPWKTFSAENPQQVAQLDVKWQTQTLPNNGWVVRSDIPPSLLKEFADALFSLQDDEAGQKLLEAVPVSRFEAADETTYAPVKAFLSVFSQTVRPLE